MVSEALAAVLRSGRAPLNAQFTAARRRYPQLDAADFRALLEGPIDALARATGVANVVLAAYELALELTGKQLAGRALIARAWHALAEPAAALIVAEPARLLGAIANGVHALATTPGARPEAWIADLAAAAPHCPDAATLLAVGQVRAWLAGLAHHRAGALAVADSLPEALALAAVGAAGSSWPSVRALYAADPWYVPGQARRAGRTVGGFRGFGGPFVVPPRVAHMRGHFVVHSQEVWVLTADAFGATLHRALAEERAVPPRLELPPGVRLDGTTLTLGERTLEVPVRGALTSAAVNETTLALTSTLTHAIALVALG